MKGQRGDGSTYQLAFTQDPLDILLMGHHFDTCLALDGVNFFSTISNLVDANKRVVYGKTAKGQVVGRCLFALTNQGKLQTFHRYSHLAEDGFDDLVNQFAQQLVEAMGTRQTESGHVTCLVSSHWYNDGCESLVDSPRAKARRVFELIEASESVDAFEIALSFYGSESELMAAMEVLYEASIFGRVSTVLSFFPHIAQKRQVPLYLRLALAGGLWAGGHRELAGSLFQQLGDRVIPQVVSRARLYYLMHNRGFVDMMIARDPRVARRILRRSRLTHVRRDDQEVEEIRCYARDKINQAIGSLKPEA